METLFIGKNIIFLPETSSTNSYAIDLLKNVNPPEGTVVNAAFQTGGKGQRGNTWASDPAKNLTVSVIINPVFLELSKKFFLYQITALACYDVMAELLDNSQFDIKIKWPNDILVNQQKIAGILIENNVLNNRLTWCVTGIGLNINQERFEGLPHATSLKILTSKSHDVNHVLKLLCLKFEKHYLDLRKNKFDLIKESYMKHLFGLNTALTFKTSSGVESLVVLGITADGLLLLEDKTGSKKEADVKQLEWMF